MVDRLSAIDVAWNDVVLRVMGSAGRPRGDAKSFFGLSDAELDRIVAGSWRCPVRPAWQIAAPDQQRGMSAPGKIGSSGRSSPFCS
jgi:hypothetical protein